MPVDKGKGGYYRTGDPILNHNVEPPHNAKRFRYCMVFVFWTIVLASAATFFIYYFVFAHQNIRLDLDIKEPWYMRRADWKAMPDYGKEYIKLPLSHVLIGHSAVNMCPDTYSCIKEVLEIQSDHQRRGWTDIGPNFFVGGNGVVFEGRGANVVGVMVVGWNRVAISVMFLGNYVHDKPNEEQFKNVNLLLEELVRKEVLTPDYVVSGHCQVQWETIPPGPNIMENMYRFEHWSPENRTFCIRPKERKVNLKLLRKS